MTDGEAITQLMHRYALAIDAKDWSLWDHVFTPDVRADYPERTWTSLEAWRRDFDDAHRKYAATQHMITNATWHVMGEQASAVAYCHFQLVRRGVPDPYKITGGAWYDDKLRMTDDGWRIARRTCRVVWIAGTEGAPEVAWVSEKQTSMSDGTRDGTLTFIEDLTVRASSPSSSCST